MQNNILVIGLGGTIGSIKADSIGLDENNLKILDYVKREEVEFVGASPFSVLSENMTIDLWKRLIAFLDEVDFNSYQGVIILHGSDTLSFTSSIIANAFPKKKIVFVASDKPLEDKTANGIKNFNSAVDFILSDCNDVFVSYDGIFKANQISSINIEEKLTSIEKTIPPVDSKIIYDKNILIVNSYVGIDMNNYNLDNVDAVLVGMFHSATAPSELVEFAKNTEKEVYFVTHKASADYETSTDIANIIYNSTIENAYARLLLTN